MSLFNRLFESKETKEQRLAEEVETKRLSESKTAEQEKADREVLVGEFRDIFNKSKAFVVTKENIDMNSDDLFWELARFLNNRADPYVKKYSKNYVISLLQLFAVTLISAIQNFRNPYSSRPEQNMALVISTLTHIAEEPGCIAEAAEMVATTSVHNNYQLTTPINVQAIMDGYNKFWKEFVSNTNLICPLDAFVDKGESARQYLSKKGNL